MIEEIKNLTKDDFKISEDGIPCEVTKATYNPFTGGYNLEWNEPSINDIDVEFKEVKNERL